MSTRNVHSVDDGVVFENPVAIGSPVHGIKIVGVCVEEFNGGYIASNDVATCIGYGSMCGREP